MSSYWSRVDSKSSDWCVPKRKQMEIWTQQGEGQMETEAGIINVASDQLQNSKDGLQQPEIRTEVWKDSPLEPSKKARLS